MNLAQEIEKQKRQKQNKKKREKAMQGFLLYIIYYPIYFVFFYPLEKLIEKVKEQRLNYWRKNPDKLKKKALKEAISYISNDIVRYNSYVLYNAYYNEDISYGNAFYLQNFFGYSFHYKEREKKLSVLYYKYSIENKQIKSFSEEEGQFYEELFKDLIDMLKSTYQDIELEEKIKEHWGQKYPVCVISIKTQ